jgi:heat shock protein HtpX
MNTIKITMLFAALTALIVGLAHLIGVSYGGVEMGNNYALIALVICGVMNFFTYWFSDKIVLRMYKARPAERCDAPKLYNIVERLARKANLPMPKVYVIPTSSPNAFATGRGPSHAAVAATEGIINLLSEEELEGVMAHELAHVKHRDILISSVAATLGGAVSYLAHIFMFSGGRGRGRGGNGNGATAILGLAAMILAPLVAAMIQMAISRGREYGADKDGARICGNPKALASALERIHSGIAAHPMPDGIGSPATSHMCIANPFRSGFVSKLFSTHPPMEERVRRLRGMNIERA